MRISELADQAGVPVSTIRYYERIGLVGEPARTGSGYRDYDEDSATRLLFVTRARRLGISCEQIAELLPVWGGANCRSAHERVSFLIDEKQAEIAVRVAELTELSGQLDGVRRSLQASAPPEACRTDLSCCVPSGPVSVDLEVQPALRPGAATRKDTRSS
jgi:DNA-binding transcriptional MerR regulator